MAIFPFRFTVWISVLYERSFQILLLKNFKDLHMFFKELACFILFSYQCSFAVLICFVCDSFVIISCAAFFVNNFFQLFLILFSLFQRRLLKVISVLLICCCRVQQPWLIYTPVWQKSTLFLKIFSKRHFDQYAQFSFLFLCTLYTYWVICFSHKKPPWDSSCRSEGVVNINY